jgi:hypothetical protein
MMTLLWAGAAESARDVLMSVEAWLQDLSVADWTALAIVAAALYWIVGSLRATVRLGPIEIEELAQREGGTAPVAELTALLRERLAQAGLMPPPEVPAGSPNVTLAAAVEASNISQGAWIAKVIELLPKPPRPFAYKLRGTIRNGGTRVVLPEERGAEEDPLGSEISLWLGSASGGRELLETVSARTPEAAVRAAADRVYRYVIQSSGGAVPAWARWTDTVAFEWFITGMEARKRNESQRALGCFVEAAARDRRNLLVRMQIANLMEQRADRLPRKTVEERIIRASARADALELYLRIATLVPRIVEARYRASVVATVLASAVKDEARQRKAAAARLSSVGATEDRLVEQLSKIADREGLAAIQLLRPWYTFIVERRLRNELEPRSVERRELKRTVGISKHCRKVRDAEGKTGATNWLELAWRRLAVRSGHLGLGGLSTGWQAHYNAACFYALFCQRATKHKRRKQREKFAKRAFGELELAFQEGGRALSSEWIHRDPDLRALRNDTTGRWRLVVQRHAATSKENTDYAAWGPLLARFQKAESTLGPGYPLSPWGRASMRLLGWGTALAVVLSVIVWGERRSLPVIPDRQVDVPLSAPDLPIESLAVAAVIAGILWRFGSNVRESRAQLGGAARLIS